ASLVGGERVPAAAGLARTDDRRDAAPRGRRARGAAAVSGAGHHPRPSDRRRVRRPAVRAPRARRRCHRPRTAGRRRSRHHEIASSFQLPPKPRSPAAAADAIAGRKDRVLRKSGPSARIGASPRVFLSARRSAMNELEMFLGAWERESESTLKLLRALPAAQYDFRPDAGGRSLGELAWHLAEGDAYMSYGIENGTFAMDAKPPNIERPRQVEALAPGYERIHREAVARIRK